MSAFEMLRVANTGLGAHQTWLDALGGNIANVNTIRPTSQAAFQARHTIFNARADGGVEVAGFAVSPAAGRVVYSPEDPLADAGGYVRAPELDLSSQISQLIMAQRGYQASVQTTKTAQDTYAAALQIGAH